MSRNRVTGMYSGLDTESLISQLVEAKSVKINTVKKEQMSITYKQDAWKDLNTKIKSLFNTVNNMRFQSAYSKKTTSVSDPNVATVVTSDNAMNAVQSLKVTQLAKTGYMTGGEINTKGTELDGAKATSGTKLSTLGIEAGSKIDITVGGKAQSIEITDGMTLGDLTSKLSSAGVTANFDASTQRIFIGAKDTGSKYDFAITADNAKGAEALSKLGLIEDVTSESGKKSAAYQQYASTASIESGSDTYNKMVSDAAQSKADAFLTQYKSLKSANEASQKKIDELTEQRANETLTDEDRAKIDEEIEKLNASISENTDKMTDIADNKINITFDDEGNAVSATAKEALVSEATSEVDEKIELAKAALGQSNTSGVDFADFSYATKIAGTDATIELNGATFTSSSNTFDINGLTITANALTTGEGVTLNTTKDTSAVYDMVKKFINEYSSLINEMDKLYNTKTDSTYKPLTDEEKAAMSDYEIEKWEDKLKEQALSKDENLNTVSSTLKEIMASGISVGGKTMHLFDFGIENASYFTAADNEKNAFHIYGDKDDSLFSTETNKLEYMISTDPDTVEEFFYKLNRELYSKMDSMSAKVADTRTYGSFYDDIKLKNDYSDYKTKIDDLEAKLADYEDKWYDKFGAMETAMAKMQSNQNAISALLGQ